MSDRSDVTMELLIQMAVQGHSFDFLADPSEDIYRLTDGEPL